MFARFENKDIAKRQFAFDIITRSLNILQEKVSQKNIILLFSLNNKVNYKKLLVKKKAKKYRF